MFRRREATFETFRVVSYVLGQAGYDADANLSLFDSEQPSQRTGHSQMSVENDYNMRTSSPLDFGFVEFASGTSHTRVSVIDAMKPKRRSNLDASNF